MKAKKEGYVYLFFILSLIIIALSGYYLFNASIMTNEKTRLQNTSDAVAYSVATVQARDFNFIAYTNRAMIANQVALAQTISLISWSRYIGDLSDKLRNISRYFQISGPVGTTISSVLQASFSGALHLAQGTERVLTPYVATINSVINLLEESQSTMHFGSVIMMNNMKDLIAKENDTDVRSVGLLQTSLYANSMIKNHFGSAKLFNPMNISNPLSHRDEHKIKMDEMKNITLSSRDEFSARREVRLDFPIISPLLRARMHYLGGTDIHKGARNNHYYNWMAMDTASFHIGARRLSGWRWNEIPFAYGAAQAAKNNYFDFSYARNKQSDLDKAWSINKKSAALATLTTKARGNISHLGGIRPFFELKNKGLIEELPGVIILLEKDFGSPSSIKTAKNSGFSQKNSSFNIESNLSSSNNKIFAASKAGAYFSRPQGLMSRSDNAREYANLYSPYWIARLKDLSEAELIGIQSSVGM